MKLFHDALDMFEFRVAGEKDLWLDPFAEDYENFAENTQPAVTEDDVPF